LLRLRHLRYDHQRMLKKHPVYVEDVAMNSILIRNNAILKDLASQSGYRIPDKLLELMAKTKQGLDSLWDEGSGQYFNRNAISGQVLATPTVASLMPIYAGTISPDKLNRLTAHLNNGSTFGLPYPIPSVPFNDANFQEDRFWSGPTWVNMNWFIIDGLIRTGQYAKAEELRETTLRMIQKSGLYEYFSALDGRGLGVNNFSWTAALTIDMLKALKKRTSPEA